jgi:hypothetical protein
MKTMERRPLNDPEVQLRNDALRHQRDEDLRDDDRITDSHVSDSRLPGWNNADEDEVTLKDDDIHGRDLDTDNGDEWDAGNVSETDLDEDDLEDNDEANFELHQVKNDKFGSLGRSITNEAAEPDPDEIPEEHEADDDQELDYPDDDDLEKPENDEVDYKEPKEVTPPSPGNKQDSKKATLGDVDESFTDQSHGRTSGRMIDHEPGSGTTGDHGAYNL